MVLQPLLKDRARSPQFFGPAIERLGFIDLVAAWVSEAEESVRLALKSLVPVGGLQALVLVLLGCLFFAAPTLQALTQVLADPCQGPLLLGLLVQGSQGERQSGLWMHFTLGRPPDPVTTVVLHHQGELLTLELVQPEGPAFKQVAPVACIQAVHRGVQVLAGEL